MRLGENLEAGDIICLQGELGAGKTTLVQGLARGWGTMDLVSSPTFILVNVYLRVDGSRLFHLDAYRLESLKEAQELDIDMMIHEGPVVVEWPEKFKTLIPSERMWIHLDHIDEEKRKMRFEARGDRYDQLLSDLRQAAFGGN